MVQLTFFTKKSKNVKISLPLEFHRMSCPSDFCMLKPNVTISFFRIEKYVVFSWFSVCWNSTCMFQGIHLKSCNVEGSHIAISYWKHVDCLQFLCNTEGFTFWKGETHWILTVEGPQYKLCHLHGHHVHNTACWELKMLNVYKQKTKCWCLDVEKKNLIIEYLNVKVLYA